jgi:uncharacterized protein (TIGR03492 family)
MKLLVLSNGHGEDVIAVRILEQLQSLNQQLELAALPIVGEGYAYGKLNIPIIGRVQQMPSGGFIYMEKDHLWEDVRGGLIQLTFEQIKLVRQWGISGDSVLAVGDIVPLLYGWLGKTNYAFVGTAKSEYYLRDETGWLAKTPWLERRFGSVYLPWERWLISQSRCKAVFPRDSLTAKVLQQWSIPVYDLGNPMMDGIEGGSRGIRRAGEQKLSVLLLPGSRTPEAWRNWQQIISAVSEIIETFREYKLDFISAIAPALEIKPFQEHLITQGWNLKPANDSQAITLAKDNASLILTQNGYQQCLHQADIAIAMAGTATEQFVGLGKPAIIMPGNGPQFTFAFAEAQSRLLGCSVILALDPQEVAKAVSSVINNLPKLAEIAINGKRRMGEAGAARRIALCLQKTLLTK